MADRVSSDHPSVQTVRATLTETTTGVRLEIPSEDREAFPLEDVIRIVLDGTERFTRLERALTGEDVFVTGVFDAPGLARNPGDGEDRLPAWADDHDVHIGGSVLVDVVEPDFLYGLRAPGETAVYEAKEPPSDSLASIAESLEDGT
ncbi:DUF7112 family protein [Natrialbaceae archaeon A-gly3]